jgi:hypothetical protein
MSGTVSLYRNTSVTGTIQFAAHTDIAVGKDPKALAVGDLDGDGRADIAIPNEGDSSITILRNTSAVGSISFSALPAITVGSGPLKAMIADLDRDSLADIAVVNNASSTLSLLSNVSNEGTLSFASTRVLGTGTSPGRIAIADIDADDAPDLLVDNINEGTLSLYRNSSTPGSLSFSFPVSFLAGKQPWSVATGDFNGDGRTDVAVTSYSDSMVTIFSNRSQVGLISPNSLQNVGILRSGANPLNVEVQDLDGDGRPDLVVACRGTNTLSLFRNKWDALAVPAAIGLIAPLDSATIGADSVRLSWKPASAIVDRYQLWVDISKYFWSPIIQTALTETSTVLRGLTGGRTYYWRVAAENASGTGPFSPVRCFTTVLTDLIATEDVPHDCGLSQNYPNPFNPLTIIDYTVAGTRDQGPGLSVKLTVYDVLGREVAVLVNERKLPGQYEVPFDGTRLSSGVYFCRMEAGSFVKTVSLLLLK